MTRLNNDANLVFKPTYMHGREKVLRNRIRRSGTYNGINAALRAESGGSRRAITYIVVVKPIENLARSENVETVEATTQIGPLNFVVMEGAVTMRLHYRDLQEFVGTRHGASNDEVERRGNASTSNEAHLSQSSTPSLAHRSCGPRSLEPIVRSRHGSTHQNRHEEACQRRTAQLTTGHHVQMTCRTGDYVRARAAGSKHSEPR